MNTRTRWTAVLGCAVVATTAAFTLVAAAEEEVKVNFADTPAAVQKALREAAPDAKIDQVEKETENGRAVYEAEVVIDGKKYEVEVDEDGKVLGKEPADAEDKEDADDGEGSEVEVKLADVPAAVRKTLQEQAKGATIDTVEKQIGKDGKTTYEADVVIGGKEHEVKVAEDGKLISNEPEDEDDDDAAAEEKKADAAPKQ